ncbi:NUDIX hydrolase domain-like protein [Crassisporium funariophilum]|nr:NUDIX hydrolase domain-like protein [Crassisporium funariophilum]
MAHNAPKILSSTEMSASEAKWITLKKIKYLDEDGKERLWECAERKTRKSTGVDAVAILAILKSKTNAFPVSTVVIEQYRPPIGKHIIEFPAGLIDEGETAEQTAIRELHEETGYKAEKVLQVSPVIVLQPGMTNANMKLVVLSVLLDDKMETPEPKLEVGEHIIVKVVELAKLKVELEDYDRKGFVVDARLSHFASGYDLANQLNLA